MTTRVFDPSNLTGVGQHVRRYAQTGLPGDIAAIGITALACYAAVVWPTIAYLLLLTAVATMPGAKTITVDPVRHVAYLFQPEYGPAPAPAPGSPPPAPGSRPPRGPVIGAWFFVISH